MRKFNLSQILSDQRSRASILGFLIGLAVFTIWYVTKITFFYEGLAFTAFKPEKFFIRPHLAEWIFSYARGGSIWPVISFVGSVLVPSVLLSLVVRAVSKHLTGLWPIALGSLAIFCLEGYPFRQYLLDFTEASIHEPAAIYPLAMSWPLPSWSSTIFLILFLAASEAKYLSSLSTTLGTIGFSSLIYLNAFDAYLGIFFWLGNLVVGLLLRSDHTVRAYLRVFSQFAVAALICAPAVFKADYASVHASPSLYAATYPILVYVVFPLALLVIVIAVAPVDYFEVISRFRFVFLLMLAEMSLILLSATGLLNLNLDYLESQTPQLLCHVMYWVPALYYVMQPGKLAWAGTSHLTRATRLRRLIHKTFRTIKTVMLPFLSVLILAYILSPLTHA